ncbi:MAG: M48 family metalloprotease [Flavobacteriaceae bacterium]|nr:M48 family metalloprotease [Flavobacteriaceae bacterium]
MLKIFAITLVGVTVGGLLIHFLIPYILTKKIVPITKQKLLFVIPEIILFSVFVTFMNVTTENHKDIAIFIAPLFLAVIPTYNFTIAPLRFLFLNNTKRATDIEQKLVEKGFRYKVRITDLESPNAFAVGIVPFYKMIFIDKKILDTLSEEQSLGIIYHEVGHHELHHLKKMLFVNILVTVIGFYVLRLNVQNFYYTLGWIFVFAPIFVLSTFGVQYKLEYQADNFGAKHTSKENMILALQNLDPLFNNRISKGGISHPKLVKRIANINNEK